ncbi:Lrp/AsnC family transcriptional regulator [Aquisediminimonas profunda]|uniref:Lrp/AsnC family transcriptional regulator n=1 Tax=Aquisediminimonas profunda TaxID=1550733 RepID=UPI001C636CFF|nr:Lrp/AsnC family transcriptional regulator [Aquisediminimonas profunda]
MDRLDQKIIAALASHARISLKDLAAAVGLASPSAAERLKRLEERGVITGYTVVAAPDLLGFPLQAIVRINPLPGLLKEVERLVEATPQIVECDRVTGEDCFVARVFCKSMDDLDLVLEPFHDRARTNTSIVKGQSVKRRLPPFA